MSFPGPGSAALAPPLVAKLWQTVLDAVYPRLCRGCEIPLPVATPRMGLPAWLCGRCLQELPRNEPPCCSICGESFDGAMTTAFRCSNCTGRRIAFDFAVSAFKAKGALREIIHQFKYSRDISLRGVLGDALLHTLEDPRLCAEDLSKWLLVPVPLHFLREMWREFNQSWELCRTLSRATGIPAAQVLSRTRRTRTQARLGRQQRLENLRGVFVLRRPLPWRRLPDLRGQRILLVDDVLTTGATAHECARVLKQAAGAEKVVVITAARG